MTLPGFAILLLVAGLVGAIGEMLSGYRVAYGWLGTFIVGLIGAWIGGALFRIGPYVGGVYVVSAILGALIVVLLLKLVTGRRTA